LADLFNTSGKQYSLQYFIQPPLWKLILYKMKRGDFFNFEYFFI
jgi:hypothetical protein